MAEFRHCIIVPNQNIAADGSVTYNLPSDPLSMVLIHLNPLNNTTTAGNYRFMDGLLSAIDNLNICYQGMTVVSASGADLAAVAVLWHKLRIWQCNAVETDNDRRSLVLPILLGRRPYMQNECFPATNPGELTMAVTWDFADTGFDNLNISIEAVTLPGARPAAFQKVSTLSQTIAATATTDISLPCIGIMLRNILLWGTTAYTGASPNPTLGQLSFLINGSPAYYTGTDYEVLRGTHGAWRCDSMQSYPHIHLASGTLPFDVQQPETGAQALENYVQMLLDVTGDDQYSLNTAGLSTVGVRVVSDIATAQAARILPIERVPVKFGK